jgi:VanZ family protein
VTLAARLLITFIFLGALFVLSTIPAREQSGDSTFVWLIARTPSLIQKSLHVALYAVLTGLWVWTLETLPMKLSQRLSMAFVFSVAFGAAMEWYQTRIPGRFGTLFDVLLNALGAVAGLLVAWFWVG